MVRSKLHTLSCGEEDCEMVRSEAAHPTGWVSRQDPVGCASLLAHRAAVEFAVQVRSKLHTLSCGEEDCEMVRSEAAHPTTGFRARIP
jgi:hypothetical protein